MFNFKKMGDANLYEYLYQSGIDEIPKSRKNKIALAKRIEGTGQLRGVMAGTSMND